MKLTWPWRRRGPPDGPPTAAGGLSPPGNSSSPSSPRWRDPIDGILVRNRTLLICGYLVIVTAFLVMVSYFDILAITELPHSLFNMARGDSHPWASFPGRSASGHGYVLIAAYVALQGALLWGLGKVYIDRRRTWRGRTLVAIVAISAMAGVLTLGALCLFAAGLETSWGRFSAGNIGFIFSSSSPQKFPLQSVDEFVQNEARTVILGGWCLWLIVALIYCWPREPAFALARCIRAIIAGSWIEFSVALPVDIAARNQEKCPCAPASWWTLLAAMSVLIWSIGPALYLIYLRERALSRAAPGRAAAIVLRKSAILAPRSSDVKVENYVATARTLSLAVILLGYVGLQLGIFSNQRGAISQELHNLVAIAWLKGEYHDNSALLAKLSLDKDSSSLEEALRQAVGKWSLDRDTPFGHIHIEKNLLSAPSVPFDATVTSADEVWKVSAFSLKDERLPGHLNEIYSDLGIDPSAPIAKIFAAAKEKLFSRKVKLPGIDFSEFGAGSAAWLIALLCPVILVALHSSVRQIFRASDGGLGEPWLVLDADTPVERIVGGIWLLAISASSWLATFGLILTVMDGFRIAAPRPGIVTVELTYLVFLALAVVNTWPAIGTALDLLRLRQIRADARHPPA